jgi:membrane protein DedA with SNARE-associated domain
MSGLVSSFGPLGVFALMIPESACIPLPSEVTLMCAGFGVRQGWMPFWVAVAAATAGNLLGSLIAYAFGRASARRGGSGRSAPGLSRCEVLFERFGSRAVFIARLLPLARTFISLPAGYARVGLGPFIAMTTVGSALWALLFIFAGWLAGAGWAPLSGMIGDALLGLTALGITALFLLGARRS